MTLEIILVALVLIMCIAADKFSGRFGMPALILFIGIGMLFGCDGIAGIEFDNFTMTEYIYRKNAKVLYTGKIFVKQMVIITVSCRKNTKIFCQKN